MMIKPQTLMSFEEPIQDVWKSKNIRPYILDSTGIIDSLEGSLESLGDEIEDICSKNWKDIPYDIKSKLESYKYICTLYERGFPSLRAEKRI